MTENTPQATYKELYTYIIKNGVRYPDNKLVWTADTEDFISFSAWDATSLITGFIIHEAHITALLSNHGGSQLLIYEDGNISINWV